MSSLCSSLLGKRESILDMQLTWAKWLRSQDTPYPYAFIRGISHLTKSIKRPIRFVWGVGISKYPWYCMATSDWCNIHHNKSIGPGGFWLYNEYSGGYSGFGVFCNNIRIRYRQTVLDSILNTIMRQMAGKQIPTWGRKFFQYQPTDLFELPIQISGGREN